VSENKLKEAELAEVHEEWRISITMSSSGMENKLLPCFRGCMEGERRRSRCFGRFCAWYDNWPLDLSLQRDLRNDKVASNARWKWKWEWKQKWKEKKNRVSSSVSAAARSPSEEWRTKSEKWRLTFESWKQGLLGGSAHGQSQDDQRKVIFPLGYYFNISICDIAKNRME
jgi:hypothetical protein